MGGGGKQKKKEGSEICKRTPAKVNWTGEDEQRPTVTRSKEKKKKGG